ncbi:RAS-like protein [Acrasis kona]|uniref:RAS-like protein n=1 Tax=Acrasis kona TaxID=1008807 RepID=A0AAW2Z6Y5_9EUKA
MEIKGLDLESRMLIETAPYNVDQYMAARSSDLLEYSKTGKYFSQPSILVLGDQHVGKSSFVRQFAHGQFYNFGGLLPTDHQHTILLKDDIKLSSSSIDYVWLHLMDSQHSSCVKEPTEGNWPRTNHWVRGKGEILAADAYIILFDITRLNTLQYIEACLERIMSWRHATSHDQIPVVIVANKRDQVYWEKSFDEEALKKKVNDKYHQAYPFCVISCKIRDEVDKTVRQVIQVYRETKKRNGFQYSNHQLGRVQKLTGMIKLF